jgi:predicted phage gp36 major capsid-like protein
VIVDRIGTTLELIPNLVGATRRPTGQRGALLWFRTGSDSVVDNAFRLPPISKPWRCRPYVEVARDEAQQ